MNTLAPPCLVGAMELREAPLVTLWYTTLVAAGVVNIVALVYLTRRPLSPDPRHRAYEQKLRAFAVPVVVQCAWRGMFPSLYLQRYTFWDTPCNAILLDRTLACVGELSWNAALATALLHIDALTTHGGTRLVRTSAFALIATYCAAEATSYYNTATTNELWAAIEVALDAISQMLIAPAALALLRSSLATRRASTGASKQTRRFGNGWMGGSSAAVFCLLLLVNATIFPLYNFGVDVPMYMRRYEEDTARGKSYFTFWEGIVDAATRRVPTHRVQDWREDMFWMVAYFVGNPIGAIALAASAPTP
jgi:hypothetical protein